MSDPRILDAFHLMWDPFPEPVLLVHKDRTVLAVNEMAERFGLAVGNKCYSCSPDQGPNGICRSCQANAALNSGKTTCVAANVGDTPTCSYWMPLREAPEIYVHFGIGIAEAQAKQTAANP